MDAFERLGKRELWAGQLDARPIPGRSNAYVAVSSTGDFCFLIPIGATVRVPERTLASFVVEAGDSYEVHDSETGVVEPSRFAVVRLRSGHTDLVQSFAVVVATLLATLSETPDPSELVNFLDSLVTLLTTQSMVSENTIVGLWGELWIMVNAPDPLTFAEAWHITTTDRFDFSWPLSRIEVKTTTTSLRLHEFSLEQLEAHDHKRNWVASLQIMRDTAGDSIADLLGRALSILPTPITGRIARLVLETVSGDLEAIQDFRFAAVGESPCHGYRVSQIPRVTVPDRSGISSVRFRVNLESIEPDAESLADLEALRIREDRESVV